MARLYPPVPRFDLPDPAFELVVALEEHLDDSYLVLQPRAPTGGVGMMRGVDPVIVIHPSTGIAAILPRTADRPGFEVWVRLPGAEARPRAAQVYYAQAQAGQWLGISRNLIMGLVYDPGAQSDPGTVVSGEGKEIALQVREALLRIKESPLRPSVDDLESVRMRFLGGDRLTVTAISPLQSNYRDCKGLFAAMRAECVSACNFDPVMEWAPRGGRDQAAGLTVNRVCSSSNCAGLR